MRVAHYAFSFSVLTETFIYDIVLEMERQGVECHVLTEERLNEDERPFDSVLTVAPRGPVLAGKAHRRLFRHSRMYRNSWPQLWLKYRSKLVASLQDLQPDIIHAHFGAAGAAIAPIARSLGIPLVVSFYGYDVSQTSTVRAHAGAYRDLFQFAALLIGISDYVCERVIQLGAAPVKVARVRLGTDLQQFNYSDPQSHFDGKNVHCLHVGRLVPKKSPIELIESFNVARRLIADGPRLALTIVGDGPLMPAVQATVDLSRLRDCINVLGAQSHERVRELFLSSHIYTQHSVTADDGDEEGQGVSLVEAAATGLPVVSTLHDGIPEVVIDGETGYLVPEHDIEGMGRCIAMLAKQPQLWTALGRSGRNRVQEHFSLQREVSKLIDLMSPITLERS